MALNPSLSYPLSVVDPCAVDARNEPARLPFLRSLLRAVPKAASLPDFVNPESSVSLGAVLAARRALGSSVLASILSSNAERPPRVCLVRSGVEQLSIEEADMLDEQERAKVIAISGSDKLAREATGAVVAHLLVEVDAGVCGSNKAGKMDVERSGRSSVKIHIVSAGGIRKLVPVGNLPEQILDRLFAPASFTPSGETRIPERQGEAPEYVKEALVDFLERKFRLQVLCTASVNAPNSRPVVIDTCVLKDYDSSRRLATRMRATLHSSSSSCICRGHKLRFDWKATVEVVVETCGRRLQPAIRGGVACPCHRDAVDSSGNARFAINDCCTEGTKISVCCIHREGSRIKRGIEVCELQMSDADREELSHIIMSMQEFEGRTSGFFKNRKVADARELHRHQVMLKKKLEDAIGSATTRQLVKEDPETTNSRELLQRDMVSVDLMRSGGVFRHVVKRGERRGCPYLKRNGETPLSKAENQLVETHGHLFRKAM